MLRHPLKLALKVAAAIAFFRCNKYISLIPFDKTNFGDLDFLNTDTSQSQGPSDIESPTMERELNSHRNGRTHNAKKRPKVSMDGLSELLTKKWKEDKEEREERQLVDHERKAEH